MDWVAAGLGFTGGLVAHLFQKFIDDAYQRLKAPIFEREKELLRIARKADGHLRFRKDFCIAGPQLLWMNSDEGWSWALKIDGRIENTGQVDTLLSRGLITNDPAPPTPGFQRWILTPKGWSVSAKYGEPKSTSE